MVMFIGGLVEVAAHPCRQQEEKKVQDAKEAPHIQPIHTKVGMSPEEQDKFQLSQHEDRIHILEAKVRMLQSLVDQLRGIPGAGGPITHNYSVLPTYDRGYHSQVVGQQQDRNAQSEDMQQPMGWSGYFGDAGAPLK